MVGIRAPVYVVSFRIFFFDWFFSIYLANSLRRKLGRIRMSIELSQIFGLRKGWTQSLAVGSGKQPDGSALVRGTDARNTT
jgi:hypothetical protein